MSKIPLYERKSIIIFLLFTLSLIYFWNLLTSAKMMYGSDWLLSIYPSRLTWVSYVKDFKTLPLWDNFSFSGHPTAATTGAGGLVYPLNILQFIFPVHLGWTILYLIHIFLAGLGMWFLLRGYKLSPLSSLIGALAFMFAGQLISTTHGGHLSRTIAGMMLPWAFFLIHRAINSKKIIDFAIFGGVTGLIMLAGQPQLCYWGMIAVLIYFILELVWQRKKSDNREKLKVLYGSAVGFFVLFLIVSISVLPPILALSYGVRGASKGYEYTTSWSFPTSELFNLIFPHFSGILENYWGENYFRLDSSYLGILPIILMGFSFFYKENKKLVKFFALFTAITLIFALGKNTPFFRIYYYLLPMAKKFRAPNMFFFLTTFGICVLSGFGTEFLLTLKGKKQEEEKKNAFIYLGVLTGMVLLFALIVNLGDQSILNWMKSHFASNWSGIIPRENIQQKIYIMSMNFSSLKKSLWLSSFLFIVNGLLIYLLLDKKFDYRMLIPILALILIIDQWSIDKKYLSSVEMPKRYFAADDVTSFVKQDKGLFRVFPFNYEGKSRDRYLQYHNIENLGGYAPNPPARYQEFIGAGKSAMFNPENLLKYPHLLSMLNVKYIIGPRLPEDLSGYDARIRTLIEEYNNFYSNFEVAFVGRQYQVLQNKNFLPRASLMYNYIIMDSSPEVLSKILSNELKTGDVVLLEEKVEIPVSKGQGEVEIVKNIANERVVDVKTDKPAFLIYRENYHPDWKCYIDNKKEKIYKADYIFYGVFVPEGEHEVRFIYKSAIFNFVSVLSLIGFLSFLTALAFSFKKGKAKA
ncbi:YfhO family protein [candidate division WOR-3 bacterium]|nr:YfhO family protein [candidate division WOR-3 bacterium]